MERRALREIEYYYLKYYAFLFIAVVTQCNATFAAFPHWGPQIGNSLGQGRVAAPVNDRMMFGCLTNSFPDFE
jgi:hypothetical protein